MQTIGLIGGMSWESTATYYRELNLAIKHKLGGLHSAKLLLASVDFAEIAALQRQNKWHDAATILGNLAQSLESSGADCIAICTNTMHKIAQQVQSHVNIPLINIIDVVGKRLQEEKIHKIGLLGTQFTMEQGFYQEKLAQYDVAVVTPDQQQRGEIHRIIFEELCLGKFLPQSKAKYLSVIKELERNGAEAILLGCTEIGLLIQPQDINLPSYDTSLLHVNALAEFALNNAG